MPTPNQLSRYYQSQLPNRSNIETVYFWEGFSGNLGLVKSATGDILPGVISGNEIPGYGDQVEYIPGIPWGQIFVRRFAPKQIQVPSIPTPLTPEFFWSVMFVKPSIGETPPEVWLSDKNNPVAVLIENPVSHPEDNTGPYLFIADSKSQSSGIIWLRQNLFGGVIALSNLSGGGGVSTSTILEFTNPDFSSFGIDIVFTPMGGGYWSFGYVERSFSLPPSEDIWLSSLYDMSNEIQSYTGTFDNPKSYILKNELLLDGESLFTFLIPDMGGITAPSGEVGFFRIGTAPSTKLDIFASTDERVDDVVLPDVVAHTNEVTFIKSVPYGIDNIYSYQPRPIKNDSIRWLSLQPEITGQMGDAFIDFPEDYTIGESAEATMHLDRYSWQNEDFYGGVPQSEGVAIEIPIQIGTPSDYDPETWGISVIYSPAKVAPTA